LKSASRFRGNDEQGVKIGAARFAVEERIQLALE
jgi:hypothetical protein